MSLPLQFWGVCLGCLERLSWDLVLLIGCRDCQGWCGSVGITVPTSVLLGIFNDCPHRVTTQSRMEC